MTTSAWTVAVEIRTRIPGIGNTRVQKLLYYAQGHHLAAFGEPLFRDTISAWDFGPVVGTLWYAESHAEPALSSEGDALDEGALNSIGYVVSRYGRLSAAELTRLTHGEPPWQMADEERQRRGQRSHPISMESIHEHFKLVAEEGDDDDPAVLIDPQLLAELVHGAGDREVQPAEPDDMDRLAALRDELRV